MKLSNLRLGPLEPGGQLPQATPAADERRRQWERTPAAPSARPAAQGGAAPVKSGFSVRRPPGRAVAAIVSGAALLLVAGIVLVSTIMADRTMMQRSLPSVAPSNAAGDLTGRIASGDSATAMVVPPEPQPWGHPQPGADVAQPPAPVPEISPTASPPPSSPLSPSATEPAQARPEASPQPDPAMLIARGDDYFARSDVTAARLFYRRASDGGSAAATAAMGSTFDPIIIEQRNVRGVRADPAEALKWYRRAAQLGDTDADARGLALIAYLRARAVNGDAEARAILERALR